MKVKNSLLLLSISLLLGFSSCKNDVEIFAPKSDVTLIYGLLNIDDDTHQFKINRVFQGENAISELAKDPTLSEYENLNAWVVELRMNGLDTVETGRQWPLNETTITNKDSGYFYYPNQKIYEFTPLTSLISDNIYRIVVDKSDESGLVESTTELISVIGDNILLKPFGLNLKGLTLANLDGPIEKDIKLEMQMPTNAKIISVYLDFTWRDEYYNGTFSEVQTISYSVGSNVINVINRGSDTKQVFGALNATAFYEFIAGSIPVVPDSSDVNDIKQRIPVNPDFLGPNADFCLNFRFVSGGDEFNTYIEVASPSTSLLETKPEYSNIKNGVGLFSSRTFDNKLSLMAPATIDYLVDGEITAGRKFCHYKNNTHDFSCF